MYLIPYSNQHVPCDETKSDDISSHYMSSIPETMTYHVWSDITVMLSSYKYMQKIWDHQCRAQEHLMHTETNSHGCQWIH